MLIRVLTENDLLAYRMLRLKGLEAEPAAFGSSYEEESRLTLKEFSKRVTCSRLKFTLGAFINDKLICIMTFTRENGMKVKHKGKLVGVYCDKEDRGSGASKKVMQSMLNRVKELGDVKVLYLSVVSENLRAVRFYESFGFVKYGIEPKSLFASERYYDQDLMYLEM